MGRYIRTRSGATIDTDHFDVVGALDVIQQVELGREVRIPRTGQRALCFQPCGAIANIAVEYSLNPPIADKYGVALAIWEDFQIKFETAQPTLPVNDLGAFGGASNFSIEDLPTDYLAFWAAAHADMRHMTAINGAQRDALLNEIVNMLGGIEERSDTPPPHCPGDHANCASQNRDFTPRIRQVEVLHRYFGICPLCIDIPQPQYSFVNKSWLQDLTFVGGNPLAPINDGRWQVTRCTLNGGPSVHGNACAEGLR